MATNYHAEIDISLPQTPPLVEEELYSILQDIYSSLQILAASVQPVKYTYKDVTASYTVYVYDQLVRADSTAGAMLVTLPLASTCTGRRYTIKRIDASANAVTLAPTSPELMDGSGTAVTIASMEAIEVQAGTDYWDIVSKT
tara:strand:+ start:1379 stop:1804 length:426 start_codon:yes stop_codon:yes gene_type:complete